MAFSPSYQSEVIAFFALVGLGAVAFSIAFICETLVLWRTGWSRFRPALAISFMMNLATFFIGTCIFAYWGFVREHLPSVAGIFIVLGLTFTAFDSLTMLSIVRWRKWPHTPSTTVGIAIGANAASIIVMLLLRSIAD